MSEALQEKETALYGEGNSSVSVWVQKYNSINYCFICSTGFLDYIVKSTHLLKNLFPFKKKSSNK